MTTILDRIFESKRVRVEKAKRLTDVNLLVEHARQVRNGAPAHRFRSSLETKDRLNVIAEFKKASPSKGVINDSVSSAEMARQYELGGACAISILTEEDFFNGSLTDLKAARSAVSLPILRKDFILDEFQIYEAAAAGADAILLIVAALSIERLTVFVRLAESELGMDALVEVHTQEEMDIAKEVGATLIGVNNRDLRSFEVSLDVSRDLIRFAPRAALLVAESGLKRRDELIELKGLGYSGFLIGETLMRNGDPEKELRDLTQGEFV